MGQGSSLKRWSDLRGADFSAAVKRMRAFTESRHCNTPDVVWAVEHRPVFSLGVAGKAAHILDAQQTPIVLTDRGGQVTYHGPGQVTLYTLLDLRRLDLSVRELVTRLEQGVISMLRSLGLDQACRIPGAPGVYIPHVQRAPRLNNKDSNFLALPHQWGSKIAALGLKIRKGCCYHGIALNLDMDLSPFLRINPCGYSSLMVTDLARNGVKLDWSCAADMLIQSVRSELYVSK